MSTHCEHRADARVGYAQEDERQNKQQELPDIRPGVLLFPLILLFIYYLDLAFFHSTIGGKDADGQHHDDEDATRPPSTEP